MVFFFLLLEGLEGGGGGSVNENGTIKWHSSTVVANDEDSNYGARDKDEPTDDDI